MIDRDILLKLARDFAEQQGRARPTLVAAYLVGSLARAEPPLGDSVDIDIDLIDYDPPAQYERYRRVSDTVLLDVSFHSPDQFHDKPALRRHALFGPSLYDAVPLYDPHHTFDLLQASLRGQFDEPENVYARARHAYRAACNHYEKLEPYRRDEPAPIPLDRDELQRLHAVHEWAAIAVLMIAFRAHTHRRLLLQLEAAATQLERPDLHVLALEGLGYADLSEEDVAALRETWLQTCEAVYSFHSGAWDDDATLHPARKEYYWRGFETLAAAGHAQNSLLLQEYTLAACAHQLLTYAPPEQAVAHLEAYAAWLTTTQKGSAEQFAERVNVTGKLLEEIDFFLIHWARNEGVAP